jgi:hypothetical protein
MPRQNWMAGEDEETKLRQLCMPGSHDACMYTVRETSSEGTFIVQSAVTQFQSIGEQLQAGTRFFDIRLYQDRNSKVIRAGHFPSKSSSTNHMGEYGPPFLDVCRDIQAFMGAHGSEVVLLKFSLSKNAKGPALAMIEQQLVDFLFVSNGTENLADIPLSRLRGKVLALFDSPCGSAAYFNNRLHVVSKKTPRAADAAGVLTSTKRSILWLNGDAPTADSLETVITKQNEVRAKDGAREMAPHLEMFYLTITAGTGTAIHAALDARQTSSARARMCVADNTAREFGLTGVAGANPDRLRSKYGSWADGAGGRYEAAMKRAKGGRFTNVFIYDFINNEVNDRILKQNPSHW